MQFPKLTPLQSRFTASCVASLILLLVYLGLNKPKFAYAHELDSRIPPDHNHPILDPYDGNYESDGSAAADEISDLKPRALDGVLTLSNNNPYNLNIERGASQFWTFPKDAIDGPAGETGPGLPGSGDQKRDLDDEDQDEQAHFKRRQSSRQVYITLNTCIQPSANISKSQPG